MRLARQSAYAGKWEMRKHFEQENLMAEITVKYLIVLGKVAMPEFCG
jgi:hypothetical protein